MESDQRAMETLSRYPAVQMVRELTVGQTGRRYLGGACVRDSLLGLKVNEFHFMVDAEPTLLVQKLSSLAPGRTWSRQSTTGTLAYYDGPAGRLIFSDCNGLSLSEALKKHYAFTVDQLAYEIQYERLLQFHGARQDLNRKLIRAIVRLGGSVEKAHLTLEAARLSSICAGFTIDEKTRSDIASNKWLLSQSTTPGVGSELRQIISSKRFLEGLELLCELGLLEELFRNLFLPEPANLNWVEEKDELLGSSRALEELSSSLGDPFTAEMPLLRLVLIISPRIRRRFLEAPEPDRTPILVSDGEHLEHALTEIGFFPSDAFKVRIITVSYVLSSCTGAAQLVSAMIDESLAMFGWKGLLGAALSWARRSGTEGHEISEVTRILEKTISKVIRRSLGPLPRPSKWKFKGRRTNDKGLFSHKVSAD